jgi:DNA-binding CsgD family transcriptional regulator
MLEALERGHETNNYDRFAECVRDCAFAWYIKAYRIDAEDAESIANEVAVKLWVNAPCIRIEGAERYIRRAIANMGREYMRQQKAIAQREWDIACAVNAVASDDELNWVAMLAVLTDLEREVAERLAAGQSRAQITREMRMGKKRLNEIIESIRRKLR